MSTSSSAVAAAALGATLVSVAVFAFVRRTKQGQSSLQLSLPRNRQRPTATTEDEAVAEIRALIGRHEDFPVAGIVFRDIFPVFQKPDVLKKLIAMICQHIRESNESVDAVVGLDARGFLLGPAIALELNAAFVPVRKAGKLPGSVSSFSYEKEYGGDAFEIPLGALIPGQKVVLFDDLLATGGSLMAAKTLVERSLAKVTEAVVLIELSDLKGRDLLGVPTWSVLEY